MASFSLSHSPLLATDKKSFYTLSSILFFFFFFLALIAILSLRVDTPINIDLYIYIF